MSKNSEAFCLGLSAAIAGFLLYVCVSNAMVCLSPVTGASAAPVSENAVAVTAVEESLDLAIVTDTAPVRINVAPIGF